MNGTVEEEEEKEEESKEGIIQESLLRSDILRLQGMCCYGYFHLMSMIMWSAYLHYILYCR